MRRRSGSAHAQARLQAIIGRLLAAQRGERYRLLFRASLRAGELVADANLDAPTATEALTGAATQIGLAREDGRRAVAATMRSGFHRVGVAYEAPDRAAEIIATPRRTPGHKPLVSADSWSDAQPRLWEAADASAASDEPG